MVAGVAVGAEAIAPGEALLVFTDGLPDAMDPQDRPFGMDRIKALLSAHREDDPGALLDRLLEAVAGHVAPGQPHDDINLVVVQNPRR